MKRIPAFWVGLWMFLTAAIPYIFDALPQYNLDPEWWITVFLVSMGSLNIWTARREAARERRHADR